MRRFPFIADCQIIKRVEIFRFIQSLYFQLYIRIGKLYRIALFQLIRIDFIPLEGDRIPVGKIFCFIQFAADFIFQLPCNTFDRLLGSILFQIKCLAVVIYQTFPINGIGCCSGRVIALTLQ